MSPFFSIVIPVYNVESYLRECLNSVVTQTFKDWEVICVDDGSTDASSKILDEYSTADSRFRVYHQSNNGVSAARNLALDFVQGIYVIFLDGDDELAPNILLRVKQIIDDNPNIDAVCYRAMIVDLHGEHKLFGGDAPTGVFPGDEVLGFVKNGAYPVWAIWDKAFKMDLVNKHALRFSTKLHHAEDSLFAQLFLAYARVVRLEPCLIGYVNKMRVGSATQTLREHLPSEPLVLLQEIYGLWRELKTPGLEILTTLLASRSLHLGSGSGFVSSVRLEGISYLMQSAFFNHNIINFLLFHGSFKARFFALLYLISPPVIRNYLLRLV